MNPYRAHQINEGSTYCWHIDALWIWVRRTDAQWLIAHKHQDIEAPPLDGHIVDPPKNMEWHRVIAPESGDTLWIHPILPPRPVVAAPDLPLRLAPGAEVRMYTAVPLWISLSLNREQAPLVFELPSTVRSNTWFGGPMTGRLAYSLKRGIYRDVEDVPLRATDALCPVRIRNASRFFIDTGRIAMDTELFRLYQRINEDQWLPEYQRSDERRSYPPVGELTSDSFCTSEGSAVYTAPDELNVGVQDRPPYLRGSRLRLLRGPRMSSSDKLLKRSLILLRKMSNV